MKSEKKELTKKDRLKLMLLAGKKFTVKQIDRMFNTNNGPEMIRQIRKEIPVELEKVKSKKTWFGRYFFKTPKKVSRITTRQYLQQA